MRWCRHARLRERAFIDAGHSVTIEAGAGDGYSDGGYASYGAHIEPETERLFAEAQMIIKVKEPLPQEVARFHPGQLPQE